MTTPQKTPRKKTQQTTKLPKHDYNKLSIAEVKKLAAYFTEELNKIRALDLGLVGNSQPTQQQQSQYVSPNYQMPIPQGYNPVLREPTVSFNQQPIVPQGSADNNWMGLHFNPVEPVAEVMTVPIVEDNSAELGSELDKLINNE